jgi:hypothetical protein
MPLYYFHLFEGQDVLLDPEGRELDSADRIAAVALREARAIISDDARSGMIGMEKYIDVADQAGAVVHRLRFADAIRIVH